MLEAFRTAGCRPDDWHLATLHLLFNAGGQVADGECFRSPCLITANCSWHMRP